MMERQEGDENFRYLGGTIHYNGLGKEAVRTSIRKMKLAYQLTGNMYDIKSISLMKNLRYSNTVIKPEGMYAIHDFWKL